MCSVAVERESPVSSGIVSQTHRNIPPERVDLPWGRPTGQALTAQTCLAGVLVGMVYIVTGVIWQG